MERLPPEVLSHIFLLSVPLVPRVTVERVGPSRASVATPLRISHVSRSWRDLALSDGRLWSYLKIDCHLIQDSSHRAETLRTIFDTWITRSKQSSLNYSLDIGFLADTPAEAECAHHIVATMVIHHHRWGEMGLLYWSDCDFPMQIPTLTNMTMLSSLDLLVECQFPFSVDFGQSSRLRTVRLYGNFTIMPIRHPLDQLKEPSSLTFYDEYNAVDAIRSCQNLLAAAPFLERLDLYFKEGLLLPVSPLDNDRPVYSGIRSIRLASEAESRPGSDVFIDNMTFPSLDALEYYRAVSDEGEKLLRFFERSSPPLTYLLLMSGSRPGAFEASIIQCLRLLPSLEQLGIQNMLPSTHFFRDLTLPDAGISGSICPKLEALYLDYSWGTDDPVGHAEDVISMLESRARVMTTFRSVQLTLVDDEDRIECSDFLVDVEISRIREYIQEGKENYVKRLSVGKFREPFLTI